VELLPILRETHAERINFSITLGGKYLNSILAHPFVPGKEIAEALIIVFASMLLATPLAPSMALLEA